MTRNTSTKKISIKEGKLKKMITALEAIIESALTLESNASDTLEKIHPNYRKSASNLIHYRALRSHDLRELQKKLGHMGLSRLAKSQAHVMTSLQTTLAILHALQDEKTLTLPHTELSFKKGNNALKANAKKLLGYRTKSRRTRIMVTMPATAADDYEMVKGMIEAGMNCARINCAHDDQETWKKIIDHVRKASTELGKKCKVAMDLAGPKIRTGPIVAGPHVMKIRPTKDVYGRIIKPVDIWLSPEAKPGFTQIPVSADVVNLLNGDETLYFRDTRNKKRSFRLTGKEKNGIPGLCERTTYIEAYTPLFPDKKMNKTPVNIGEVPPLEVPLVIRTGDKLRIDKEPLLGEPAIYNEKDRMIAESHISCTAPELFNEVNPGERILFDDGKIEGVIESIEDGSMFVRIIHASGGVAKLRSDKGINLPDSLLTISGLTEKDKRDLPFVAAHADVVNVSFVNRPDDIRELLAELEKLDARDKLGIILKIETKNGYNQLTEILLEAMQVYPIGVMIARGDLAIESGWSNIGRVQEEILSLCQAAHITDIWATQVLEGLAKKGIPSRSEITDAVMAQRADCVMLNKGPYILQAIRLLDSILTDMEPYWEKNAPMSPMLEKAGK